jgi:hypothetical protein
MVVTKQAETAKEIQNPAAADGAEWRASTVLELARCWSVRRWSWCAHEPERWRHVFLDTGIRGLKTGAASKKRELSLARMQIVELIIAAMKTTVPWATASADNALPGVPGRAFARGRRGRDPARPYAVTADSR